jgi:hypothetical protein
MSGGSAVPRRRLTVVVVVLLAIAALLAVRTTPPVVAPDTLPTELGDTEFWRLVSDFSEPNGYFRSDNFLSNERAYQRVIPTLTSTIRPGGVYLGVGPEQNFTYIVALKPKLAFIVDIRRGNLDEHLLYKAFIEMSADRGDFLSRLFARPRPAELASNAPVETLFNAYEDAAPSQELFDANLQAARQWLTTQHSFALTSDDLGGLEHVYSAFYQAGPSLNYSFLNGGFARGGAFPSYVDLMTETDGRGEQRGYLASEENFRTLKQLERNNAIVPVVGNFAGPKALRSVGRYLNGHNATVSAFYTSNVEMYLFQTDDWMKFFGNVATLPISGTSTFIRSVSGRGFGFGFQNTAPGARGATRLCSIADLLKSYRSGRIRGYGDVIAMSQ